MDIEAEKRRIEKESERERKKKSFDKGSAMFEDTFEAEKKDKRSNPFNSDLRLFFH